MLIISQFTLHASTRKGNRPSFIKAASGQFALEMYNKFSNYISSHINGEIKQGEFGKHMLISLVNDGPVTIIIDSKNRE